MWTFIPICLLCSMIWRMKLVGGGPFAVEREGPLAPASAPAPCLWVSRNEATMERIGEPFMVGVDEMSSVGHEGHTPGLCLWVSSAETAGERTGDLAVSLRGFEFSSLWPVWIGDPPQRLFCLLVRGKGKLTH